MEQRLNLFIAYSPADEEMKNEMEKHLSKLRKSKKTNVWSNINITVENKWDEITKAKLKEADVILILISQNFLNTESLWKEEVAGILDRHSHGTALVIPIILTNFVSSVGSILNLLPLPKDGTPIEVFTDRGAIYNEIFNDIEELITSFSKKQKWLRLIEEEVNKHTGKLDLRNCELASIPNEIQKMEWLEELYLSNNKIITIQGLEQLTALNWLDLSGNGIITIQGLEQLTALNRLDLSGNGITTIQGLEQLTALNRLDLSGNGITTIQGLEQLTALNGLYLSVNQITTIQGLEQLTALKELYLSNNEITTIQGLEQLTALKELYLSNNQITTIQGLEQLTALKELFLSDNQITTIQGLEKLTALKVLYLSDNQITTIQGLDTLTALNWLDLYSNQITTIQGLEVFPMSIENLYLFDNPIENISRTIFGTSEQYNCINDLKNFFAENVEINVPEVKIILTGNSDVGKTKFRIYLTTGIYDNTRNSTHGLEVYPYQLDDTIKQQYHFDKDTKIYIWDFGGQEYFHNTHQLFFNQHAVYIFLWEKETNKNKPIQTEVKRDDKGNSVFRVLEHFDADYWLSNIRHFAKDAAIILVQNKVDDYEKSNKPLEWLSHNVITKYNCNNQYNISIIKTANKDLAYWYDFEKLKYVIYRELQTFVSKNKEGKIYNQVRKEIERLHSANYWKVEDFIAFIENLKSSSASVNAASIDNRLVIEHFSRQGKVLYPTNQALENGKVIFTNPQWLSQKIYEILNEEVLQRNGFFGEKDLTTMVENKKFENEAILQEIVELMKQYNIVFYNPNRQQYIAPQYLPEVPTVHYSQVKKLLATPKLIIKIEGFLPKSVINNIFAKYAIKDDAANYYKYGVKTEDNNNILLIEVKYQEKKIYVFTDAIDAIYLRDVFSDIVWEFGITLNRDTDSLKTNVRDNIDYAITHEAIITPTNDKLYISIDDKIFVDWIELWNTNRSSDKNKDKDYCIAEDGNMVLRRMFAPFYLTYNEVRNIRTNEQLKPSKLFISYSSKNTDFMRRFVTHLEPLKRNGTIELWYDRMIEPGTKWDDSIKEEMKKSDLIVFLLSPDFIATNYIFEFEIPQAIKQMEIENSRLFFIELQPCSWDKTVLARFQQTTDPAANNKVVIMIEHAMNDAKWKEVIGQLEQKIIKK